jgi:hypothetical protein
MIEMKEKDILLGRGPVCYRHPGNVLFRNLVKEHYINYKLTTPRLMKKLIVKSLIDKMHGLGSRFLVRSSNEFSWHVAHPHLVQAKVGHALRDARMVAIERVDPKNKKLPGSGKSIPQIVVSNMNKVSIPNCVKQAPVQGIEKKSKIYKHPLKNKEHEKSTAILMLENEKHTEVSAINVDDNKSPTQVFGSNFDRCINAPRFR